MYILDQLEDFPKCHALLSVTIGNFDGLHKGHVFILEKLRQLAKEGGRTCVITFSNHPSQVLRPEQSPPLLCTPAHKIKLFEQYGIDYLCIIPFTPSFAAQSASEFIDRLRSFIPLKYLVLGYDARLGKDRQGDKSHMLSLAAEGKFEVHYLEAFCHEGKSISSSSIRQLIQEGKLSQIENVLGRPYSIYSVVDTGMGKGRQIGFPTANVRVQGLCLPPLGVYVIRLKHQNSILHGIANLGVAPTIKSTIEPTLEVHLFSEYADLYGEEVEVIFHQFLRTEIKFDSVELLKIQIQKDIDKARSLF